MHTYGRRPRSIMDLEQKVVDAFVNHPRVHYKETGDHGEPAGEPLLPGDALRDVFAHFNSDGAPLMDDTEIQMFDELLASHPEIEISPSLLLGFIAQRTKERMPDATAQQSDDDLSPHDRGSSSDERDSDRDLQLHDLDFDSGYGRSPSEEGRFSRPPSRPPSRGPPATPTSAKSPFDAERRQRSTPLHPPSTWTAKRPPPMARRKSDAGNRSDSEPFQRSTSRQSRSRGPSNPASPMSSSALDLDSFPPIASPGSRPPSRQHGHSQSFGGSIRHFSNHDDHGYSSPEDVNTTVHPNRHHRGVHSEDLRQSINSIPIPRGDDSDSDDEESVLGLVTERDIRPSNASMAEYERLEALAKQNKELQRKRIEAEELLHRKVAEHETEYAELQLALEQLRDELSATKREEKELRSKERTNNSQIAALEQEVAKVTKQLETARTTYSSLQKQYLEQCNHSERYRQDLREREETIRSLTETVELLELDKEKGHNERSVLEERISQLEQEIETAQNTYIQLEEQKQENLLLKETIDRMRFEMDDMRNNMASNTNAGSGTTSAAGTISKSLGAELAGKIDWDNPDDVEDDADMSIVRNEVLIEEEESTEGEEEEDVIQTIITRKKRKVTSKAQVERFLQREFEEAKEYSDTGTQYDPTYFAISRSAQTDAEPKIIKASFSTQTDVAPVVEFAIQTEEEVEVKPVKVSMEIQTEEPVEEASRSPSPSPQELESLASSDSTAIPPTPRQLPLKSLGLEEQEPEASTSASTLDQPPAYHDHNWAVVSDVLKKWHAGAKIPVPDSGVEGGISEELVDEWKALKEELGVDCLVIDKIIANSKVTAPRPQRDTKDKRRSRFYNIYNTYVYGDDSSKKLAVSLATQAALMVGASALVILAVTPYVAPYYAVPGGATYYDRVAWNSFNSMTAAGEGFAMYDGTSAVWNFLGRVGGGAARMARGWPT